MLLRFSDFISKSFRFFKFLYFRNLNLSSFKSSHQRCSVKKGVLRSFATFTGKHLCQSLFFHKVAGAACSFIKKETLAQVFSCEFCEISKNTFFTEHLWATASVLSVGFSLGYHKRKTFIGINPFKTSISFFAIPQKFYG